MTVKRTQKAGGSCGATNNKMKVGGGSKKSSKKSSHKLAAFLWLYYLLFQDYHNYHKAH